MGIESSNLWLFKAGFSNQLFGIWLIELRSLTFTGVYYDLLAIADQINGARKVAIHDICFGH